MRLRFWRKQKAKRRHPTPTMAYEALADGRCMYALISNCNSRAPRPRPLRDIDDSPAVLVCGGHYPQLRKLGTRDAERLEHFLVRAFAEQRGDRDVLQRLA